MLRMQALDPVIADHPYAGVILTSANAARAIATHPRRDGLIALPAFAIGGHTEGAARLAGFREVHCADGNRANLVNMLRPHATGTERPMLYLAGEDRAGAIELSPDAGRIITAVVYRMAMVRQFPAAIKTALVQAQIDGVLHFSRRCCQAYLNCAGRANLSEMALAPVQFCLSRQVADPLFAHPGQAVQISDNELAAAVVGRIRIAPHPNEAALIGMIDS
jgi:uroporphyrinogen-III synthase